MIIALLFLALMCRSLLLDIALLLLSLGLLALVTVLGRGIAIVRPLANK
jgi:hypothetical protein